MVGLDFGLDLGLPVGELLRKRFVRFPCPFVACLEVRFGIIDEVDDGWHRLCRLKQLWKEFDKQG